MKIEFFVLHFLHALAFFGLLATTGWRLKQTNAQTLDVIRLSIWALFCTSMVMLVMPFAHDLWPDLCPSVYRPHWPVVALAWAVFAMQFFTAKHWAAGVPACYQKDCKA